ncbi:hypothetical protein BDV97DRAFT_360979 [Delphinella strobiligena]|nr:hypothetical protein BDV97DRAFT_360979 [Delphinella strobiligena]
MRDTCYSEIVTHYVISYRPRRNASIHRPNVVQIHLLMEETPENECSPSSASIPPSSVIASTTLHVLLAVPFLCFFPLLVLLLFLIDLPSMLKYVRANSPYDRAQCSPSLLVVSGFAPDIASYKRTRESGTEPKVALVKGEGRRILGRPV